MSENTETETEAKKSFLDTAQETITGAFETTVDAVKSNPVAAAGIAAGVAAAVGGAAFAATKLKSEDEPKTSKKK